MPGSRTTDPMPSVTRERERGLQWAVCAVSGAGGGGEERSSNITDFGFVWRC